MEYTFKVWIDGNYYHKDEEFERVIELSDSEVATIKELIDKYDDDLSCGLMPILYEGSEELYQKFYDAIFPHVFFVLFQRDEYFEPKHGDEDRIWDEDEDVEYLMETYGDGYDFDDAYIVYIPNEIMPPKMKLSKGMSKDDILKYIRKWSNLRESLFDDICYSGRSISNVGQDIIFEFIDKRLLAIIEKAIEQNDEETLAKDDFDPFKGETQDLLANEIFEEFQKETNGEFTFGE